MLENPSMYYVIWSCGGDADNFEESQARINKIGELKRKICRASLLKRMAISG